MDFIPFQSNSLSSFGGGDFEEIVSLSHSNGELESKNSSMSTSSFSYLKMEEEEMEDDDRTTTTTTSSLTAFASSLSSSMISVDQLVSYLRETTHLTEEDYRRIIAISYEKINEIQENAFRTKFNQIQEDFSTRNLPTYWISKYFPTCISLDHFQCKPSSWPNPSNPSVLSPKVSSSHSSLSISNLSVTSATSIVDRNYEEALKEIQAFVLALSLEEIHFNSEDQDRYHECEIIIETSKNQKISCNFQCERNDEYEVIMTQKKINVSPSGSFLLLDQIELDGYELVSPFQEGDWLSLIEYMGMKKVSSEILIQLFNGLFSVFHPYESDVDWK